MKVELKSKLGSQRSNLCDTSVEWDRNKCSCFSILVCACVRVYVHMCIHTYPRPTVPSLNCHCTDPLSSSCWSISLPWLVGITLSVGGGGVIWEISCCLWDYYCRRAPSRQLPELVEIGSHNFETFFYPDQVCRKLESVYRQYVLDCMMNSFAYPIRIGRMGGYTWYLVSFSHWSSHLW